MSNLDLVYTTKVEVDKPFQVLMKREFGQSFKYIIMTPIEEDEEKILDNNDAAILHLTRGSLTFNVSKNQVIAYGDIDLTTNSEDYNLFKNVSWYDYLDFCGIHIPSNYDYEENLIYSDVKGGRWYDSMEPEKIVQFRHGQLGKPKKVLIFKAIM